MTRAATAGARWALSCRGVDCFFRFASLRFLALTAKEAVSASVSEPINVVGRVDWRHA